MNNLIVVMHAKKQIPTTLNLGIQEKERLMALIAEQRMTLSTGDQEKNQQLMVMKYYLCTYVKGSHVT